MREQDSLGCWWGVEFPALKKQILKALPFSQDTHPIAPFAYVASVCGQSANPMKILKLKWRALRLGVQKTCWFDACVGGSIPASRSYVIELLHKLESPLLGRLELIFICHSH